MSVMMLIRAGSWIGAGRGENKEWIITKLAVKWLKVM